MGCHYCSGEEWGVVMGDRPICLSCLFENEQYHKDYNDRLPKIPDKPESRIVPMRPIKEFKVEKKRKKPEEILLY